MTDVNLEMLQKENADLKNQVQQGKAGVDGLLAQLDATKQMYNEGMNQQLQLRTSNIMLQKAAQELQAKVNEFQKQVDSLNQQLVDATANLAAFENAKSEVAA
jgi:uncharacterized protein YlxW (UPF0749 family)